jgi:hypothetical protein
MDFLLQAPTRRCTLSGRELKTGDRFYGALVADGPRFARQDYALDSWPGPPEHAIAYWAGRVPADDAPQRPKFDDEMLIQCYQQLNGTHEPAQLNFRYVLALLLMRRKRLRLVEEKTDAFGQIMVVSDTRTGVCNDVRDPRLSATDMQAAQKEIFRLMGWD